MNKHEHFAKKDFRSGFIALIGRPNVGKSTLVNQLVGEKVSITSPVAQTTRNRLRAILTTPKAQLVIVDTPGIHKPHHLLGKRLVQSARGSIAEVDLVVVIFDASSPPGKGDAFIIELLKGQKNPVLFALNKSDLVENSYFEAREKEYRSFLPNPSWPMFSCSAINGNGCNQLVEHISGLLPLGPHLYPSNMVSDQPEKILLAELIREQVLFNTREEIPHSVAVVIDRVDENFVKGGKSSQNLRTAILATVLVERKTQKGILIGKGGSMLKVIGSAARIQMQKLINGPVHLELFVKVVPNWRKSPSRLAELGYDGQ
ncbi:GTPase Era [Prochlorococcus sp. MIT 1223]|uniref:GTPase Era n=1 Tax=Prochlorococcus sp. MIT 1223 TaxID=3096217 RepID=UPI002A748AE3|nr:GTPase Era [Prochlorococcus sp. MIT 1223]